MESTNHAWFWQTFDLGKGQEKGQRSQSYSAMLSVGHCDYYGEIWIKYNHKTGKLRPVLLKYYSKYLPFDYNTTNNRNTMGYHRSLYVLQCLHLKFKQHKNSFDKTFTKSTVRTICTRIREIQKYSKWEFSCLILISAW